MVVCYYSYAIAGLMSLRFRKSIKLAPGIRMNLSSAGASWTFGPRGASVGIGKRGAFLNTGIPGTGLYHRQALSGGGGVPRQQPKTIATEFLSVSVDDEGVITFQDSNGNLVPESLINTAKKQQGETIRGLIQQKCDEINSQLKALEELHLHVPLPNHFPTYQPRNFDAPRPIQPKPKAVGFFASFFKRKVAKVKTENAHAQLTFETELRTWEITKTQFENTENERQELVEKASHGDPDAMEAFFGEALMDIVWPRETIVSFEVRDGGTRLVFDIDLPEVEDMPNNTASFPKRGYRLSVTELAPGKINKVYAKHIHSIGFRLLGEVFGMLPTVEEVTLSGYSQRKSKTSGQEENDYLFSAIVTRDIWDEINFDSLQYLDVVESFTRFKLRRKMTNTGVFKAIQPF